MEKKMTSAGYFDKILTTNRIQILKTALPYVDAPFQKYLAIYIKFLELQYTISYFKSHSFPFLSSPSQKEGSSSELPFLQMFHEMKEYCGEEEKKKFEQIFQMFQAFQMYEKYQSLFQNMDLSAFTNNDNPGDFSSLFQSLSGNPDFSSLFQGGGKDIKAAWASEGGEESQEETVSQKEYGENDKKESSGPNVDFLKNMMSPEQKEMYERFLNSPLSPVSKEAEDEKEIEP